MARRECPGSWLAYPWQAVVWRANIASRLSGAGLACARREAVNARCAPRPRMTQRFQAFQTGVRRQTGGFILSSYMVVAPPTSASRLTNLVADEYSQCFEPLTAGAHLVDENNQFRDTSPQNLTQNYPKVLIIPLYRQYSADHATAQRTQ